MEPHKVLPDIEKHRPPLDRGPSAYFQKALEFARAYYSEEMDNISSVRFDDVTPDQFFREYVWVVHATGFSAKAVGNFMPRLMVAYGNFRSLSKEPFEDAFIRVKAVCNNRQKAAAVHKAAKLLEDGIAHDGWEEFRTKRLSTTDLLSGLPYVGKVTCFHLGRNVGLLECVKPDLHLIRMAKHWGFKDCESMCAAVRPEGMPLGIVDLVLWYAASTFGTLEIRADGER